MSAGGAAPALDLSDVQRLVLRPGHVRDRARPHDHAVRHIVLHFGSGQAGHQFIRNLQTTELLAWGTARPEAQRAEAALGLSFRGLEVLGVPDGVLHVLRRLSPACAEGAAARASARLGDSGPSAPRHWDEAFAHEGAHALLTLHGTVAQCDAAEQQVQTLLDAQPQTGTRRQGAVMAGARLPAPPGQADSADAHWMHFGYRDGITRLGLAGDSDGSGRPTGIETHAPGELLLGEPRDIGDNPGSLVHLPAEVRRFFRHGSFGALRRIQQHEAVFEREVERWARVVAVDRQLGIPLRDAGPEAQAEAVAAADPRQREPRGREAAAAPATVDIGARADALAPVKDFVRAKLCGRWPSGQVVQPGHGPLDRPTGDPEPVPDFSADRHGVGCPFGAHIRRMNPRALGPAEGTGLALADTVADAGGRVVHVRPRPLFRRGMPYGGPYRPGEDPEQDRGLLGLFFCSDLEDQFEHLLGQWADRLPLGFPGDPAGKDPLIGAHDEPGARFLLPRHDAARAGPDPAPLLLRGFQPFVRTRGTLYAFYPSQVALQQLLDEAWVAEDEPWWVD